MHGAALCIHCGLLQRDFSCRGDGKKKDDSLSFSPQVADQLPGKGIHALHIITVKYSCELIKEYNWTTTTKYLQSKDRHLLCELRIEEQQVS